MMTDRCCDCACHYCTQTENCNMCDCDVCVDEEQMANALGVDCYEGFKSYCLDHKDH